MSVYNVIIPEFDIIDAKFPVPGDEAVSVGIHPWYINQVNYQDQLDLLGEWVKYENVKLIGECGLDRLKGASLDLQHHIFEEQIRIASEVNKPLIIHCVRCFNELIGIKKRLNPSIPLIIHGFNSKKEIGAQLLKAGFYFSLGAPLLNNASNAASFITPSLFDRIFLENDDKQVPVENIYQAAASLTSTSVSQLKDTIFANWMSLLKQGH